VVTHSLVRLLSQRFLNQSGGQQVYDAAEKQSPMLSGLLNSLETRCLLGSMFGLDLGLWTLDFGRWTLDSSTRSNSLYTSRPRDKGAPDEEPLFIRRREPLAYHPKMGR
jgi:hypothetical protein